MAGNTPIFNFPYPTGTDPVAQGDNDIRALAEDVETVINSQVGLWKTAVGTVTAQPTLTVDNCFNAGFQTYRVVGRFTGSTNTNIFGCRFIDGAGATINAGYFSSSYNQDYTSAGTTFNAVTDSTRVVIGFIPNAFNNFIGFSFDIYDPFSNSRVQVAGQQSGVNSGVAFAGGQHVAALNAEAIVRGLVFQNSAGTNMTGTVRVYGYKD